jgi:Leucine-rich repeat (LRR) protein
MEHDEPKALIVRPTSGLQQHDSGAEKVLSRIVSDALTLARRRDIADPSARIRVGKYEFREQDYQQIMLWAQEASESPEALVTLLEREKRYAWDNSKGFVVDDGSIKEIAFPKTALFSDRILRISDLRGLGRLRCSDNELIKLNLVDVPALRDLDCAQNQLTELNLSNIPELESLDCATNQISGLDLSNVPALTFLNCDTNCLSQIDLSPVPILNYLNSSNNELTELDPSKVPVLNFLYCSENHLTEVDISKNPQMGELDCSGNQLTELDLSKNPRLTSLRCENNQINQLDIRENQQLKWLKRDPWVKVIKREGQYFKRPVF